jgi:phenylacetate-CoA ligase
MLSSLRKLVFYGIDYVHGGLIQYQLSDIKNFYNNPTSQHEIINRRLKRILFHAADTTEFYRRYRNIEDLNRYPVIKKCQIQSSRSEFLSSDYLKKKLKYRKTSGSYGTPMRVCLSKEKYARQIAELIYYNKISGLEVGETYLNVTTNKKGKLEKFIKHVVTINPAVMHKEWYHENIQIMSRHKNIFLIGFPSVLYPLARHILNTYPTADTVRLKGIITIAEPLNSQVRKTIQEAFKCPIYNRYAMMEIGVVGYSTGMDSDIYINQASYIVEVLSFESDYPVSEGADGRIVVTDLFSYAMPLIRYETGDTATLINKNKVGAYCVKNPEGRIVETIYRTDGLKVSWAVIYDIMDEESKIIQYQFCQTGANSYRISLHPLSDYPKANEDTLRSRFMKLLGNDACIEFKYVDSIPPLPSGKRPMIINTYRKG